jgi:AsmA protein
VGVRLKNVQLENSKGFEQPLILSVKAIDVQVELIPLFNQEIEVKRFELDTPHIWLTQHEDGNNNWSSPQQLQTTEATGTIPQQSKPQEKIAKPSIQKAKSQEDSLPITFNAKLLRLNQGLITWTDAKGQIVLEDIQLKVTDLQLLQPIGIDLSAKLGTDTVNIHAKVGPLLDLNTLDTSKLPLLLQLQSKRLSLATLAPWLPELEEEQIEQFGAFSDANISMDISLEQHTDTMIVSSGSLTFKNKHSLDATWKLSSKALKSLQIQSLKLDVDNTEILTLSGKVRNIHKKPRFEARIETSKLQRIWLNSLIPALQDLYKEHPKPWKDIKLAAFIAGDANILEIRNLQLELDDEPVQISGDIALGKAPDIQLRITANTLHLDPWIPQGEKTSGQQPDQSPTITDTVTSAEKSSPTTVTKEVEVEPDLTFLRPWYLSVQLNAKSIFVTDLQLDNLRMTLSSEKGVVRLNPLSFDIGDGQITENFTLYANQYPATWKESIKMSGVSVGPILGAVADFDKLSGIAQLSTELSGKGLLADSVTHSLSGRGNFTFKDGQFEGVDIAKSVRKLTGNKSQGKNTDFAQMTGSFYIKNAVLTNNDLYMASPLFRLTGKGKVNLDPPSLDYHVRPRLVESLSGQGGSNSKKGVVIPLHIYGPFDDINVATEIDRKAVLESAAALNKAAGNKIGGTAGKILDQGFVKTREEQKKKLAQKLADEKKRAQKKAEQKAKDKLKDVLKGFKF